MPSYVNYPIRNKRGVYLYAQTLDAVHLPVPLPEPTYAYATLESDNIVSRMSSRGENKIPIKPWFFKGLPSSLRKFLGANLRIRDGGSTTDIALAGARPVGTNSCTITLPEGDFVAASKRAETAIKTICIRIYVSRDTENRPYLKVDKEYYADYTSDRDTPKETQNILSRAIPDVPYFVFNLAAVSSGGPGREVRADGVFSGTFDGTWVSNGLYAHPGGGSGAGGLFNVILSTKTVELENASVYTGSTTHKDQIIIIYRLARYLGGGYGGDEPRSSADKKFALSSIYDTSRGPGIDFLQVHAELHYALGTFDEPKFYRHSANYTYPGGYRYLKGSESYGPLWRELTDNFITKNYKTFSYESESDYDSTTVKTYIGEIYSGWAQPTSDITNLSGTTGSDIELSIPLTEANPEGLIAFPISGTTGEYLQSTHKTIRLDQGTLRPSINGICGRPSILSDGPKLFKLYSNNQYIGYGGEDGSYGAGGGGAILTTTAVKPFVGNGGPATILLSW